MKRQYIKAIHDEFASKIDFFDRCKKFKVVKMKCYIELNDLGQTHTLNGQPYTSSIGSLSLLIDSLTILFNVPENLQRLMMENQITKHKRVTDIFFTRIDLSTISGLLGTYYIYLGFYRVFVFWFECGAPKCGITWRTQFDRLSGHFVEGYRQVTLSNF